MKKIYSFVLAAVAVLSAASCQQELTNEPLENIGGGDFTVTAIAAETKTALAEDGLNVVWNPGDKISLFNASGAEVVFSTDITENSATADFTNDTDFDAPASLLAVAPTRTDKTTTYEAATNTIKTLHIAGSHNAVAGNFDSRYAWAVGTPKEEGSTELVFNNIHSLVKFTVGGEEAPSTVSFTNKGRDIAGNFDYNLTTKVATGTGGAESIGLSGTFAVGETYYFAVIPGEMNDITLTFDGKIVYEKKGAKTFEPNKIYDLGEVSKPVAEEVVLPFNIERIWGYYSTPQSAWWNEKADGFKGSWFGGDANLAMDDEYVYMPFGTGTAGIYKIKISTGEISTLNVEGVEGGTYPTSCARMVKNTDSNINGGKDILLVSNLALAGEPLKFYAYVNGIDVAPKCVYNLDAARRFGDKFTVTGTWQSGNVWLRSNQDNPLEAKCSITNGSISDIAGHRITNEDDNCISEISWYPVSDKSIPDYCLMSTTSDIGLHLMTGCSTAEAATEAYVCSDLAKTFGCQFFEVGGEKYMACTTLKYGNGAPRFQIIKADASSAETLKAALEKFSDNLVVEFALSNEANNFGISGCAAAKTLSDCAVRVINNEIYIAALGEQAGLSMFKITAKQ